jgi:branched-chain amino acid transport system ATP-binding protein
MLAIGRALISEPKLIMLDEPSAGLAPQVMRQVFDIVAAVAREEGSTVLLAEQNAHQVMRIMNYAYVMDSGQVVVEGDRETLLRDDTVRATYLGETGTKEPS